MNDPFAPVAHYPTLREDQRIEAREKARANLLAKLGGEPQYDDFVKHSYSKYGPKVDRVVLILMGVFLVAAFLVSALHVFYVGKTTFREGIDDTTQAIVVGLALVVLAETAVLVLSIIPALWDMPKTMQAIMYGGAISAAFIAAIGNIDVTITYTQAPLDWFVAWAGSLLNAPARFVLATMPPALTLIVGQGLKYRILSQIAQRYQARIEHEKAMETWQRTVATIERHSGWIPTWANTLWDTWRKGKRREMLEGISLEEKRLIVSREMAADSWFDSEEFHWNSRNQAERSAQTANSGGGMVELVEGDMSKAEKAKLLLTEHPDLLEMPRTEAMSVLGVGGSTFYTALKLYERNGHGSAESEVSDGHGEEA